ncbi:ComF family protein [bacterium]|nr:ComF family protein [bacterium]
MFQKIAEKFLNLIYKQKCLVCKSSQNCAKDVQNYMGLMCKTCAKDVEYLSSFPHRIFRGVKIFSATKYSTTVKKLITLLKFSHRKNASIPLAIILFNYFQKTDINKDSILCYPSSFLIKSAQRGYEHMFLITKEFSKLTNIPFEKNLIQKVKYTKPQYKAKNRAENIKNSFKINEKLKSNLQNKNIIILDDITTSGATAEELINLFLDNGINNLSFLTVAKAQK